MSPNLDINTRRAVIHPDAETLAQAAAERLLTFLLDAVSDHAPIHLALTGGTVGIALLERLAASPALRAVDWTSVHLWWGDERFLPTGDPERNETQARAALLDELVDGGMLPEQNIHPMPALAEGVSPSEAAAHYSEELSRWAPADALAPTFDLVLLGMGPDGHIASLFSGLPGIATHRVAAVGVEDSPKPPPQRVSLTLDVINAARQVWLVAAGEAKAEAVARAWAGTDPAEIPAAGVHGTEQTLWLLDLAAASGLAN